MVPRRARPLVVLLLFWAVLYLPHLARHDTLPARDVAATQIPWRVVWHDQVAGARLPIWDPYSNHGRPLAANPNAMASYPGTLLFLLVAPEIAAAWHLALHHLILLCGCYWLARRCGAGAGAAGVAAAAVGTSGVALSLLTFVNAQASFAWAPWALGTAVDPPPDAGARVRRALAGGALLGLSGLGGEPVAALLAALAWAAAVLTTWPRDRVLGLSVGSAAACLVAAPVLVPLLSIAGETARGAMGASAAAVGADALAPRRFVELLAPNLLGPPLADAAAGFWAQPSFPWLRYYPLVFPGALLLLAVSRAGRDRRLRLWWGLLAAGLLAAALLGWTPAAAAADHLLGGNLRFGIKLTLLSALAAVPLAAAGWQRLAEGWPGRGRRSVAAAVAAAVAFALPSIAPDAVLRPALAALYPASQGSLDDVPGSRLSAWLVADAGALAAVPLTILAAGPSAPVVMVVALAANSMAGRGVLLFDSGARWAEPPAAAAGLESGTRIASIVAAGEPPAGPDDPALRRFWAFRAALAPNYGTRWRLAYGLSRGPDGLEPLRQELLAAVAGDLGDADRTRLAAAIGVAGLVEPSTEAGTEDGVEVAALVAAPEVYLAARLIPCEGVVAAVNALSAPSFRPGRDAVIDGRAPARVLAGGEVAELAGRPDRRGFDVEATGPGLLVVQQSYMKIWRATVDGAPTRVEPANYAFLGVPVPAGRHRVVLEIDPLPYRLGLCGPLLVLGAAVWLRRRNP